MIRAALIVFLALIGGVTPTWSQYFQCPPGSTQMGGSPIWCQCPDGSAASIYGCPQARPQAPPARPQIPPGATRCGSGYCDAGKKCMRNGRQCMNRDAVDCGTYACSANWSCSVGTCMPPGAIHCGDGFCPSWQKCINHRCLSAEEQQQRGGLLKRILTRIIELNPANPMRGYELYSGQKLSTSLQQQSIGSPPQVQQSIGSPPRVWNPAIGQMLNDPYVGQPVTTTVAAAPRKARIYTSSSSTPDRMRSWNEGGYKRHVYLLRTLHGAPLGCSASACPASATMAGPTIYFWTPTVALVVRPGVRLPTRATSSAALMCRLPDAVRLGSGAPCGALKVHHRRRGSGGAKGRKGWTRGAKF